MSTKTKYVRPFLKWAGGKYRILPKIHQRLPKGKRLVEPFVGSGVVFLNTHFDAYLLADINPDLIDLYKVIQKEGTAFIDHAASYFDGSHNTEELYYSLRAQFNTMPCSEDKGAIFLYLNRHGYNGLCRYNKSGEFNVPYGRYVKPYFPRKELLHFHQIAQRAEFICCGFEQSMDAAQEGDVYYCDPPYVPLNVTSSFATYYSDGFCYSNQELLAQKAEFLGKKGIPVLLSNHLNDYIVKTYHQADIYSFEVQRFISCKGEQRNSVKEVLALYGKSNIIKHHK